MLQQSIRSRSKGSPRSPTFLQPCWPQGQPAACLRNTSSLGLRGMMVSAPSLSHWRYCCSHYREPAASSQGSTSHHDQADLQPSFWGGLSFSRLLSHLQNQALGAWTIFTSLLLSCGKVAHQFSSPLITSVLDIVIKKGIMCCLQCLGSAPTRNSALLFVVTEWWSSYGHLQAIGEAVTDLGKEAEDQRENHHWCFVLHCHFNVSSVVECF